MTWAQAVLLGVIQGVTEFLPISSSAHLILLPYALGWEEHGLRFDVVTNAGTLLAAMVYFRRDLAAACRGVVCAQRKRLLRGGAGPREPSLRAWLSWGGTSRGAERGAPDSDRPGLAPAVLLASVPILVVALLFYDWFATAARQPVLIASTSIGFGMLLWWADHAAKHVRRLDDLRWRDSAWIGAAQALALIPGTSRSGITITAGLFLGLERHAAARFSFLLAIPVGVLALAKDALDLIRGGLPAGELAPLAIGFVTAAISAYLVIGWLLAWLRRQDMTLFVVYRVVLGLAILGLLYVR